MACTLRAANGTACRDRLHTFPTQVWEAVQPDLRTDASCVAVYRGVAFTTSAGVCRVASLAGGVIK